MNGDLSKAQAVVEVIAGQSESEEVSPISLKGRSGSNNMPATLLFRRLGLEDVSPTRSDSEGISAMSRNG